MCFVDLGKAFDRVPRIVFEWAMGKKGIPEVFIRSVMSLHKVTKTRVRVDSGLSGYSGEGTKDLCCDLFLWQWW